MKLMFAYFRKSNVRGLYIPYMKVIALNAKDSPLHRILVMMHELFHYFTDLLITNCELWRKINISYDKFFKRLFRVVEENDLS